MATAPPARYISELLRQPQDDADQEHLEGLLLEALASPAREMEPGEWDEIRREGLERLAARKSA